MRDNPWKQSAFFYFNAPWQWVAFHAVFLFCAAALMLGWRTSWVKWLVLIGHISYDQRNPEMTYGVHAILASLLVILCFAPIGRAISLDRVREVRLAKRKDLAAHPPAFTSPWAFACTRLMQIQMAVLFFFSATDKLRGNDWWDGDAIWNVFVIDDYYNGMLLDLFASQYWLVNVATYATILIEIAFPFMIWQRASRPYLLAGAVLLHLQFASPDEPLLFLVRHDHGPHELRAARLAEPAGRRLEAAHRRHGDDLRRPPAASVSGRWRGSWRSTARQISVRDFRTNPSPVVSDEKMHKRSIPCCPTAARCPASRPIAMSCRACRGCGGWCRSSMCRWLSRLFGHPIYNWIAANRSRL